MAGVVLDASALLAFLHGEPGADRVESELQTAQVSSVNWSEVVQKALGRGVDTRGLRSDLEALGLEIVSFTAEHAEEAARLWPFTRPLGLSLGDRACLALARLADRAAVTADGDWVKAEFGVEVLLIR
ncbi:MAG: type II toxin-antitoxin system VapC family toxin [Deferrisomatales bacterium]